MKKYFFGGIALMFAIASVAFTAKTTEYFKFNGTTNADLDDETKWSLGQGSSCSANGTACYVESAAIDITEFRALIVSERPQSLEELELIDDVDIVAQKPVN